MILQEEQMPDASKKACQLRGLWTERALGMGVLGEMKEFNQLSNAQHEHTEKVVWQRRGGPVGSPNRGLVAR
jgi:hypothetical protein